MNFLYYLMTMAGHTHFMVNPVSSKQFKQYSSQFEHIRIAQI